jgi:hypothetical protein
VSIRAVRSSQGDAAQGWYAEELTLLA